MRRRRHEECGYENKHSPRLFWRLYLYGFLLLISVAGAAVGAYHLFNTNDDLERRRIPERMAKLINDKLENGTFKPESLTDFLNNLNQVSTVSLAVFDRHNSLIASAGELVIPAFSPEERDKLPGGAHLHKDGMFIQATPLIEGRSDQGYLAVAWKMEGHVAPLVAVVIFVLLVLAALPLHLARSLGRPLDRMTETAHKLGFGDLSARTGIDRRDEIGTLARSLDRMAERIERLITNEKELLANVSHELRTPLSRIRVALELVQESNAANPDLDRRIEDIVGDLTELERLIEDVFLTTRLAPGFQGSLPVRKQAIRIGNVLEESLRKFKEGFPDRAVEVQIDDSLPAVDADPLLLRRVVCNLLDNAAKYDPTVKTIDLRAHEDDGFVRVEVCDRGPGVSTEDLPQLFEPFFQSDRSRSGKVEGVGLGLTLCKRIIEAHDGDIQARIREGGGLIVSFSIPVE